jgi:hypothetical protein
MKLIKSTKGKVLFVALSTLVVPLLIFLGFYVTPEKVEVSEEDFYSSYIKEMNEYGFSDVERLMGNYFSERLKKDINLDDVKESFKKMEELDVKYGGTIVEKEIVEGEIYLSVEEWIEVDGERQNAGIMDGLYILVGDSKKGFKIDKIVGSEPSEVETPVTGDNENYEDLDGWNLEEESEAEKDGWDFGEDEK